MVQSSVGVAPACGNRKCEAGESISCPSDCVSLQNCPDAEDTQEATGDGQGPCSGHGRCNYLEGTCTCDAGYTGEACGTCDELRGYFWEEQMSYCRKAQQAVWMDSSSPSVERSFGGFLTIGAVPFLAPGCDAGGIVNQERFWLSCTMLKLPRYRATNPWSIYRFGPLDTALRSCVAVEETPSVKEACPKIQLTYKHAT